MRIAYLDCFAGISGDMFLGALIDAGVPAHVFHEAVAALHLGASLEMEKVDRAGITSTKVRVLENGHSAEADMHNAEHSHAGSRNQAGSRASDTQTPLEQRPQQDDHQHHPRAQHLHKTGHAHVHEDAPAGTETLESQVEEHYEHTHGRSLTVIRDLIRSAPLAEPVKSFALKTFELLGTSEAKIHNVPLDKIHFHEVGAVDAIVDIICAGAGIHHLDTRDPDGYGDPKSGQLRWHSSSLNVGGGMVQCAHGNFPVPAPATADLLRGMPTYSAHLQKELVTPTGAAILRSLSPAFGPQPAMTVEHIGYGAGTRDPKGFPNVLRLSLGTTPEVAVPPPSDFLAPQDAQAELKASHASDPSHPIPVSFGEPSNRHAHTARVTVLETALDDLSPQILAHVSEQALALGAFDVMTTSVGMKKGRPGTLLTILTDEAHSPALERLLLRETSTLGIRVHQQHRICLERRHITVVTTFGDIRIKVGSFDTEDLNAAPEFEDCRAAALIHNVPVKQVLQAAIAAYVNATS